MTKPVRYDFDFDDIVRRYEAGESSVDIATSYGCHGSVILYHLRRLGVQTRGYSEGQRQRILNRGSGDQRRSGAGNRGKPKSARALQNKALANERTRSVETPYDRAFGRLLAEYSVDAAPQKAVDRYNLDFLVGDAIAVEILRGGTSRLRDPLGARRFQEKARHLSDRGIPLLIVATTTDNMRGAAEYLITYLEELRRDPTMRGEYRVIRSTGELIARGRPELDEIATVGTRRDPPRVGA